MVDFTNIFFSFGKIIQFFILGLAFLLVGCNQPALTPYDMKRAKEFILSSLHEMPSDPSNAAADNAKAAALGEKLFFDTALSANAIVSCGSCHQPEKQFQDGLPLGVGIGSTERRTMPLRGAQWSDWFFWGGRKDSQWSQALEPLETPSEHGMTRDMVAREVLISYAKEYRELFGPIPEMSEWPYFASPLLGGVPSENWIGASSNIQDDINRVFSNTGKAIAAYQRTLMPAENKFDRAINALLSGKTSSDADQLSDDEMEGFKLFAGKARCDNCHSGPLFTDQFFHNTGVPISNPDKPDYGRAFAVLFLKEDTFSCRGNYSDARPEQCRELRFMSDDPANFEGSFKTPGLRGVATRAPYMHAGQIETLEEVVEHYIQMPDPFAALPELDGTINPHGVHTELQKIELTGEEKKQLIAFLKIL